MTLSRLCRQILVITFYSYCYLKAVVMCVMDGPILCPSYWEGASFGCDLVFSNMKVFLNTVAGMTSIFLVQ